MILFYVRHGDPIYDPDSLTELGHKQAEALCERFKVNGLDKIYASSSNRAILTATPTAKMLDKEIEILDWCNESYIWGEFSVEYDGYSTWPGHHKGLTKILASKEMYDLRHDWVNHAAFEKSNVKSGMERINRETDNFFANLGFKHNRDEGVYYVERKNSDRIALFAHQGFSFAFISSLLDIPYPAYALRFDITHTGVTIIYFDENAEFCVPRILSHSNDSHILKADLPLKYNNGMNL